MNRFLKVQEHDGLVRDSITGAIINVDENSYKKYKSERNTEKQRLEKELVRENRLNTLEKKVDMVEEKLNKILELLTK